MQDEQVQIPRIYDDKDIEILRMFYEFKYKTIMEAATKLMQFAVFAVTVASLFTGLTFVKDIDFTEDWPVVTCMGVIIFIFLIVGGTIMYGIVAGLTQVKETLRRVSPELFVDIGIEKYIRRGIVVLSIVMATCAIGLVTISIVVLYSIGFLGNL